MAPKLLHPCSVPACAFDSLWSQKPPSVWTAKGFKDQGRHPTIRFNSSHQRAHGQHCVAPGKTWMRSGTLHAPSLNHPCPFRWRNISPLPPVPNGCVHLRRAAPFYPRGGCISLRESRDSSKSMPRLFWRRGRKSSHSHTSNTHCQGLFFYTALKRDALLCHVH